MKKHPDFPKKKKIDSEHTTASFIIGNEVINFIEASQSQALSFIPFTQVAAVREVQPSNNLVSLLLNWRSKINGDFYLQMC